MKEIKLTQGKVAIVDDEDYEYLRQFKWCARNHRGYTWYAQRFSQTVNGKRRIILMHRYIMDTPDGMETDHINHNGLDNRRENLRICTCAENRRNNRIAENNTTGYKGVGYTTDGYIRAQIRCNNKKHHLGHFKTVEAAAKAYNKAALKYHGEFANLNII